MNKAYPELAGALERMLDAINADVVSSGYIGESIEMYLAGGMAVNYYCGTRYTQDVDASFSRRLLLPVADLVFAYTTHDGVASSIYLDGQYNTTYAVLHENFELDSGSWEGIGNERRVVKLKVLSPVDLATFKLSRFLDHDQVDILALAEAGLIDCSSLRARTIDALSYFVGNSGPVLTSLEIVCKRIEALRPTEAVAVHPVQHRARP